MRVLSFSIAVPHEGMAHAGGEFYFRHVKMLLESGHHVTVVAPRTPINERAARLRELPADVLLLANDDVLSTRVTRVLERFRPVRGSRAFFRSVRRSTRLASIVGRADLIEFQWTQMGDLQRAIRSAGVPTVLVSHDVMSQSVQRDLVQAGVHPMRRLLRRMKKRFTSTDERLVIRSKSATLAFSRKDRELLRRVSPGARIEVVEPPLEPKATDWSSNDPSGEPVVLFVGAFDRDENSDAAIWLMQEIWPSVVAARPDARLVLAGGSPTPEMKQRAESSVHVEVTGYLPDLDDAYRSAAVVVVPLQNGAGVKFKTVTAMMWGLPIVTTPVGAEGIAEDGEDVFAAVTEDPARFAEAVLDALRPTALAEDRRRRARDLARTRYGESEFRRKINALYVDIAGRGVSA